MEFWLLKILMDVNFSLGASWFPLFFLGALGPTDGPAVPTLGPITGYLPHSHEHDLLVDLLPSHRGSPLLFFLHRSG